MADELVNRELIDFQTLSGLGDSDYVIVVQSSSAGGKIKKDVFIALMTASITPSIQDGYWWIGSVNTEVQAEAMTPMFRKGELGIEWKYDYTGSSWALLVPFSDIKLKFSDLTSEDKANLKLTFADLTASDIATLQQPAKDMIAVLTATNTSVNKEEATRKTNETNRQALFSTAIANAEKATDDAESTATHPTYIGEDMYVYEWDLENKVYNKTDKVIQTDSFKIDKVYSSVQELENDTQSYNDGAFALVNTGDVEDEDNAKLYVRENGAWVFLVDLSGAIGFTGHTPQLLIGTVSIGSGKSSASVTLTADGEDANGNPKYKINYVIPCLAYEDLTEEQIASLQKPATDIATILQATNTSITEAENARVSAENARVSAENTRSSNEKTRISNEEIRSTNEDSRIKAESSREDNESIRQTNETARVNAEQERVAAETERETIKEDMISATSNANDAATEANTQADRAKAQADNPPKMGDNGNWWKYDEGTGAYVDTGVFAKGGILYPTFSIDEDMYLQLENNDSISASMFSLEDDCLILNID